MSYKSHAAGGRAAAKVVHQKAVNGYNANPNICGNCGKPIPLGNMKVTEARHRKYCSISCANLTRYKAPKKERGKCPVCGVLLSIRAKRCRKHGANNKYKYFNTTKKELFAGSKNWFSARSSIVKHAYKIFWRSDKEKVCAKCGYNKHIEVCHIKAVSEYPDSAMIEEINSLDNLIGLCPNCHWEFDHKE